MQAALSGEGIGDGGGGSSTAEAQEARYLASFISSLKNGAPAGASLTVLGMKRSADECRGDGASGLGRLFALPVQSL